MTLTAAVRIRWSRLDLDITMNLEPGRIVAVMGPNGAGKSTLIRALAGLTPIHEGRIESDGAIWDDPRSGSFVPPASRNVGLVFQDHLLFGNMTVLENVAFGPRARGASRRQATDAGRACLERLGIADLADLLPEHLSGGQCQRVALARALVNQPAVLLLDEPLASLDITTRRQMRTEISRELGASRPMTVLVTHDPDDARQLADHVVVIEEGRIVQSGTCADLADHPSTPYVRELFSTNP